MNEKSTELVRTFGRSTGLPTLPCLPAGIEMPRGRPVVDFSEYVLRVQGLLGPESSATQHADQFWSIKRKLFERLQPLATAHDRSSAFVMICSALPGEGKTFSCVNLALAAAVERDLTVVLVDGNFPNSNLSRSLSQGDTPGLLDYLASDDMSVGEILRATTRRNVYLVPSGANQQHAADLLSGPRMQKFAHTLERGFPRSMVIVDTAPVLMRPDAQVVAHWVDHAIMVVRAGATPRDALDKAIAKLAVNEKLSLLLNQWQALPFIHQHGLGDYSAPPKSAMPHEKS